MNGLSRVDLFGVLVLGWGASGLAAGEGQV